jgi:hypothetical protein
MSKRFPVCPQSGRIVHPRTLPSTYWTTFECGGNEIVTHYLATLDISTFDPKAPPPKTLAFREIVDAGRAPEDAELQDAIDKIQAQQKLDQPPAAVTVDAIISASRSYEFNNWLRDKKNRRSIPHRFEAIGCVPVRKFGRLGRPVGSRNQQDAGQRRQDR